MKPVAFVVLVSVLSCLPEVARAAESQVRQTVDLDGSTWKVTIRGDEARVGPSGLWLYKKMDAHYFESARHAAEIASGCKATHDHAFRSTVYIELDCQGAPAKS